jgi:hypothetical protein
MKRNVKKNKKGRQEKQMQAQDREAKLGQKLQTEEETIPT